MPPIQGSCIWTSPKPYNIENQAPDPDKIRLEFPYLVRFRDHWYCSFREGQIHGNHPSGQGRVIRSANGTDWETAHVFQWAGGDVRDPRLSVTADGQLMVNTSIAFVRDEPDADGRFTLLPKGTDTDTEHKGVARQSVTWLSPDGENWSSAHACPTGVNTWRWDVTWHGGMGYSVGYSGKDKNGTLYRTRDGKHWRPLVKDFFHEGNGSEASITFDADDVAYCLARESPARTWIGIGQPPLYQRWTWHQLRADVGNGPQETADVLEAPFGGPLLTTLSDGRLLAAGRVRGTGDSFRLQPNDPEGKEDGRVTLFWVDTENAVLRKFVDFDGTSYPGVVEHEGQLWVTYVAGDRSGIALGKVDLR